MDIKGIYETQAALIKPIEGLSGQIKPNQVNPNPAGEKTSFSQFLLDQVKQVNSNSLTAEKGIADSISGKDSNPHNILISLQKADISFRLLMSVKERITQAYQEIIRTPLG
ncbi:MAG: flagellar hook-basal body complex protein FliE [Deltaproteobacteria bacterium]|nr:flagellar hook-basal body complex protein FliE [Deltaproteobacteria bacterium]